MGIAERREREKRLRREQITNAARNVFSEKGFSGATMESIAHAAELSPATLYIYYRNKDELYANLNLQMLDVLIEKVEGVYLQKRLSPEEKLKGLEKALYEVYESDPVNLINVLQFQSSQALRNLSPELSAKLRERSGKALRTIAGIFEDGIREDGFMDRHPIALADIVWGLFAGLVLWEETP